MLYAVLAIYLVFAYLIISKKLDTIYSLPMLAIGVLLINGVPFYGDGGIFDVITKGAGRLSGAYLAIIFGSMLGRYIIDLDLIKSIIRTVMEYNNTNPKILVIVIYTLCSLLYTVVDGLGVTIMIGSLIIPIMSSIGVRKTLSGAILIASMATGLTFNFGVWSFYLSLVDVTFQSVVGTATIMFISTYAMMIILICMTPFDLRFSIDERALKDYTQFDMRPSKWGYIAFILPILLVAIAQVPIIPAFLISITYLFIIDLIKRKSFKESIRKLTASIYEGTKSVVPPIILMIGIGIILVAFSSDIIQKNLAASVLSILPENKFILSIGLCLLTPLALYRGPLNLWGLGSGLMALVIASNLYNPLYILASFLALERMQVICDPTNTHNVWVSQYLGLDPFDISKYMISYTWGLVLLNLVAAYAMY